ncbi:hypothetical protein LTV02_14280 [Nocardia yamanashiensis]|uniref:hypothetical protein n=1 Tax=Nocardia yamanashiensis TaxID=209247 RepID=UPI001E364104|nr:hypothetical protein [Nocardia yamanashiensis]UGT44481.1 hypothetical protein LTV02_14280 [Nocardia yamanashiensis]
MSYEEKRTWILGIVAMVSYAVYIAIVLVRARDSALTEVAYVAPMLWAVGVSIAVSIVGAIVVSIASRDGDRRDQRDRQIDKEGERVGNAFVVIGALGALALALADRGSFWIANVLYLGFTLSAVFAAMTKIAAYQRGFWPW